MLGAMPDIRIAQDERADQVLSEHPFALLAGMLLDQQFPMERAFAGPAKILDRFGSIDPTDIAAADPDSFRELCSQPPAIHRFPGSMAERVQALAAHVVEEYAGDTARLWGEAASGKELMQRLTSLPGFGKQKAQIFVALLGKQLGVRPPGWDDVAGDYASDGAFRSVADVVDPESLQRVRDFKKAAKSKARQQAT
jgi:uncharacterized HhH-GPD family protein